jgi:hypothetical protein
MKKFILSLLLTVSISLIATAQNIRANIYSAYIFDDAVDGYYDPSSNYAGTINAGFQWGVGLEYMMSKSKGIELKYLRQDTKAPMSYVSSGPKSKTYNLGINYILLGGSNYFKTEGGKVEPYLGGGIGMAIISIKNPSAGGDNSKTKFAWDIKGGTNIWFSPKAGLKLQIELLSAVQSVGGGLFFGTGGAGAGVSTYSSMLQLGMGGGLVFKLGK